MNATLEVVILPVSDPDKSLDFYRDKLGFTLDVDYAPVRDFPQGLYLRGGRHCGPVRDDLDRPRRRRQRSRWQHLGPSGTRTPGCLTTRRCSSSM